ncbi:MAG: FAD-binding oxidoreductase, partial [Alphaproteobacteria bacterium]
MSRPAHAPSYYAATANQSGAWPELVGEARCDVCVVGGGFTGLSAALHLAERSYSVVLLEAARLGWGASGRNGGQLSSGLRIGASDLVARFGRDEARRLWELAEEAKATVRERIAKHDIDCDLKAGNLYAAAKRRHLTEMARDVACQQEVLGYDAARLVGDDEVRDLVATQAYFGGVLDMGAGHLHPLNYALGLAAAAQGAGAKLHEGSAVSAIDEGREARVRTARGWVRARHVVLACNGYLGRLEPRIAAKIMPIGSYMLATAPLPEARAKALIPGDIAIADSKFVVDYYRLSADRRLLFCGGETYTARQPRDLAAFVRRHMLRVFPQLGDLAIDYAWGGQLAITLNHKACAAASPTRSPRHRVR